MTLETDIGLTVPLPPSEAPADVVLSLSDSAPAGPDLESLEPVDAQGTTPEGAPVFAFYGLEDRDVVRISGALDFHCWPDRIVCHLVDCRHRYLLEIALFGMVFSLWLERRGVLTFHASTVVIEDSAVGFLAPRGGGKTSTAAAAVASGHALLADDLLAVDLAIGVPVARPGYPQLRLWPEQVSYFVGPPGEHPTFHPDHDKRRVTVGAGFGRFSPRPAPLGGLYLTQREPGDRTARVHRLAPREAAIALVKHSFLPREVVRFGLQPARLARIAALLRDVPVARLHVPEGLDALPRAVEAVAVDLSAS